MASRATQAAHTALADSPYGWREAQAAAEAYEASIISEVADAHARLEHILGRERRWLKSLPGVVSSPERTRLISNIASLEGALACLTTALRGTPKERNE